MRTLVGLPPGSTNGKSALEETSLILSVEEELDDVAGSACGGGQMVKSMASPILVTPWRQECKIE